MKFISIAGATSKAGKTLLAEQIIRYCASKYKPVYGIKFTTTSDLPSPCPRGAPCTVCDLSDNFRVIRDPEILLKPGKNTQRLAAANATEVIWVIAKKSQLPVAFQHLLTHLPADALAVMEGSSITALCKPDLLFYIFANHIAASRWKESATEIMGRSDVLILNHKTGMSDHPSIHPPKDALVMDLAQEASTSRPEIRNKIDAVMRSLTYAIQSP